MNSIRFGWLVRLVAGVLLLLLAHGLIAPGTANAGCSHLVRSQSNPYRNFAHLDELMIAGSLGEVLLGSIKFTREQPLPDPYRPCAGLACSSRESMPSSTVSHEPEDSYQWGTLFARVVPGATTRLDLTHDEPVLRFHTQKISIFHPPRV